MKHLLLLLALSTASIAQPIPNTYVATGAVSNIDAPYNVAAFGAYGTLLSSSSAELPIFIGARYELYRDSEGKPAYGGMATAKIVPWRKGRFFAFADGALGAAGSQASISSVFNLGGGVGVVLGKSLTPHWEAFIEPRAQRIPALANGTSTSVLIGISYSFNRPN